MLKDMNFLKHLQYYNIMLLNQGYLIKYSLYIFSSLFNFGSYEKYTLVNCLLKLSNIPLKTFQTLFFYVFINIPNFHKTEMNLKYYILLLLSFLSTYWLYHHHFSVESNEDTMLLKKIWPSESSTVSSFMKKFVKQESSNKNLKKQENKSVKLNEDDHEIRLLQNSIFDKNYSSLQILFLVFSLFFIISRDIALFVIIFNKMDLFLPYLSFLQFISMLGLWPYQRFYLKEFYTIIFTSKLDIFNLIRGMFSSQNLTSSNQTLKDYQYTDSFLYNMSGQLLILGIFLFLTLIIKSFSALLNFQKIRTIHSNLKPIWIGILYYMMPRFITFIGFQFNLTKNAQILTVISVIVACVMLIIFVGLFFYLIISIRKVNAQVQLIQEGRIELGLGTRLKYMDQFQFDCLQYSMLHYISMDYLRLIIGFLCLGCSASFSYVQYGGVVGTHVIFMMIVITCPKYQLLRDNILENIMNFILFVIMLCKIGLGLMMEIKENENSKNLEIIIISLCAFSIILLIIFLVLDIKQKCMQKSKSKQKRKEKESDEESTNSEMIKDSSHSTKRKKQKEEDNIFVQKQPYKKPKNAKNLLIV